MVTPVPPLPADGCLSPSYSAPILATVGEQRQVIAWTSDHIVGLQPEDGKVLWEVPHKTINGDGLQAIASPVVRDDLLLCLGAFSGRSQLLRLDPDKPTVSEIWSRRKKPSTMFSTPYFPSSDHFYASLLDGRLACLDAATGEEVWANEHATGERAAGNGNTVHLTPNANGDSVFLFNQKGQLILARLSPAGYEEFGRCWLLEPTNSYRAQRPFTWAHPAYANKCIYVRNDSDLSCASFAKGDGIGAALQTGTQTSVIIPPLPESPEQKAVGEADVLAISKDGTRIASAYVGTVKVFDWPAFSALPAPAKHRWRVAALDFSPDGKLLVSAGGTEWKSADGTIKSDNAEVVVWDLEAHKERARLTDLHTDKVMAAAFSPDGKTLATGGADWKLRLWDMATKTERLVLSGHRGAIYGVAFSPDGTLLATGSGDQTIKLWDVVQEKERATLRGHESRVTSLSFTPEGSALASCADEERIKLWKIEQ